MWLGRRLGRLKLRELGELAGGMDYSAVCQAVSRFARQLERDRRLKRQLDELESRIRKC